MAKDKQAYDWLEDPFDDSKKDPAEKPPTGGKSCLLILVALLAVLVVAGFAAVSLFGALTGI